MAGRLGPKPSGSGPGSEPASLFLQLSEAQDVPTLQRRLLQASVILTQARRAELWYPDGAGILAPVASWPEAASAPSENGARLPAGQDTATGRGRGHLRLTLAAAGRSYGELVVVEPARTSPWLACLAAHGASCLACLEALSAVKRSTLQLVTAFSRLVELRDHYVETHSVHIAELALQVGLRLGLTAEQLDVLTYAALLHDLGKVTVPDAILHKPGPLSPEEWEVLRQHPTVGSQALQDVELLRDAAQIVEQHHERFDGTGYPKGLAGQEIRIEARIIAAVDAYDAMTTNRPYRRALPPQQAVAELRRGAGTQFDPEVVDALIRVLGWP